MATRTKTKVPDDQRVLLVKTRQEGTFKITVPADWKVTFGKAMAGRGYDEDRELRIYEADTKQRACFTGVVSFRDLSLPIVRMVKSKSGEVTWEDDGDGNRSEKRYVKTDVREVEEAF